MINKKLYTLFCVIILLLINSVCGTLKKKGERNSITKSLYQEHGKQFNLAMLDSEPQKEMAEYFSSSPSDQELMTTQDIVSDDIEAETSTVEPEPIIPVTTLAPEVQKEIKEQEPILPIQPASTAFTFTDNSSDIPLELRTEMKNPDDEMADALEILNARKEESIEFHFENASLEALISQIETIFNITFITDDAITPEAGKQGARATLKGHKITFKTNKPLTRDAAWNLFTTFLEISGFSVVPLGENRLYRIQPLAQARKAAIRSFIGVEPEDLPTSDEIIRYVYFIKNSTTEAITNIVKSLKSNDAPMVELREHKAFLLTDKAYNIRILMQIIKELDQTTRPQSMAVLKLQRADALQVKQLYESLINPDQQAAKTRVFRPQQKQSSLYFPEDMKIIAEKRTNTLILLGPQDAIKKVEEFIIKYIDIDLDQPYSPLHVIELKYANASAVADILREVTKFGEGTQARASGGVRGGDKYLKKMSFVAEESTNRLIVRGDYEDFLQVKEIVEKLDAQQAQVAIEILILDMADTENKQLGTQLRSKVPGTDSLLGKNVQFQTSGLFAGSSTGSGIIQNTTPGGNGATKLLGNLIELVTGAGPGNTIINLGHDAFGVWGVFQMLQTISNVHVISNPFLMATNKTEALVSLGTTRRVVTSIVQGNTPITGQGDQPAALTVKITPQINSDGMITLDYEINITEFTNPTNPSDAATSVKRIKSKAVVADQEILALGGLVRNQFNVNLNKVPILGDIPGLGWLFKNKNKAVQKQNLLILVSTRVIPPSEFIKNNLDRFSAERYKELQLMTGSEVSPSEGRDPIHRAFFNHKKSDSLIEDFIFERGKVTNQKRKTRSERRQARKESRQQKKEILPKKDLQKLPISKPHDEINYRLENPKPIMVQHFNINTPVPSSQTEVRV